MNAALKYLLPLLCCFPFLGFGQQIQLVAIQEDAYLGEVYPELNGQFRYRFYLQLEDPADQVLEIYGTDAQPAAWGATQPVTYTGVGNLHGALTDCGDLFTNPSVFADPFLTIGIPNACTYNSGGTAQFGVPTESEIAAAFSSFPDTLELTDFSIALPADHPATFLDGDNRMLIGQMTTEGLPYLKVNVRVFDASESSEVLIESVESEVLVYGCTDPLANNYSPTAVSDDDLCTYGPLRKVWWQEVTPELPAEDYPAGHHTYRLYAQLTDSLSVVSSVYATENDFSLYIGTTTNEIWNSEFGASLGSQINPLVVDVFPEVEYDSWVTIGMESTSDPGDVQAATLYPSTQILLDAFGNTTGVPLELIDGAWFSLAGENAIIAEPDSSVLLAQVTTEGALRYAINLQIIDVNDDQVRYVHTPNPDVTPDDYELLDGEGYHLANLPSPACLDPNACNYFGDGIHAYHQADLCEYDSCIGCTDPSALNYDVSALIDGACVFPCMMEVSAAGWICQYNFTDEQVEYHINLILNYSDALCNPQNLCLTPEGGGDLICYNFDALGIEPSSGSLFSIPSNGIPEGIYTLTLDSVDEYEEGSELEIEVSWCFAGCTDVEANNFTPIANLDDGSCTYDCPAETPNPLYIQVETAFYASYIAVELLDPDGETVFVRNDFLNNATTLDSVCLANGCHTLLLQDQLGAGSWEGSQVVLSDGIQNIHTATLESGYWELDLIPINASCPIDGCTDPQAENYNALATIDDGSCVYQADNPGQESTPPEGNEITLNLPTTGAGTSTTLTLGGLEPNELLVVTVLDGAAREVFRAEILPEEQSADVEIPMQNWASGFFVVRAVQQNRVSNVNLVRYRD